ncbi:MULTISPECIES: hypothetical protein [unclassified Leifsonia]|uniref:hypothetical protein n=1 Tax=unclassified Leifsonia TaxID=2663824 RepID=UPI0007008DC6|nr:MULTISPECIES: hypothetical protein [unclassified Leifsonia]KQX08008.1 hypothetical protein ASC59_09965 [Leifsonia sp. Root1293]KRA12289.1 hypothetical protein ASD61_09965 [Leifsonia sp. Root60]
MSTPMAGIWIRTGTAATGYCWSRSALVTGTATDVVGVGVGVGDAVAVAADGTAADGEDGLPHPVRAAAQRSAATREVRLVATLLTLSVSSSPLRESLRR